jgi:hypothetical protein
MLRLNVVCLLLLAACGNVFGQNVVFSTRASAEEIGSDGQVQVDYVIQDAYKLKAIIPQNLNKDFEIIGGPYQGSSKHTESNGRSSYTTVTITISYLLKPKRHGNLTIPAAVATDANGQTYRSNTLPLKVHKGCAPKKTNDRTRKQAYNDPQEAQNRYQQQLRQYHQQQAQRQQKAEEEPVLDMDKDLFLRVVVDKPTVHVGEQVTATYLMYARLPMKVNILKLSAPEGFWTQDFATPQTNMEPMYDRYKGHDYYVFVLKKSALFPHEAGKLEIAPAAEGVARVAQEVNLFDDPMFSNPMMMGFDDDFFKTVMYKDVHVELKSKPAIVDVKPLPADSKPMHHGGAVGQFAIKTKVDKKVISTYDMLNYQVSISGTGNIKLITPPVLSLPAGLTATEPQITDTVTHRDVAIGGSKIITYSISADTPGNYVIPSLPFSYFNPESGSYVTINTDPVTVQVTRGRNKTHDGQPDDIHQIATGPLSGNSFSTPLLLTGGYWSAYAVPALAFLGLVFWRRREEEQASELEGNRGIVANRVALKRLAIAQHYMLANDQRAYYDSVSKAIWLYLSDKLSIPLSELSYERAQMAMTEKNVATSLQQDANRLLEECEIALYANRGGNMQMSQTYQQAVSIISQLEEAFNA